MRQLLRRSISPACSSPSPRPAPALLLAAVAAALAASGCGAIATSPSWVGGGLAVSAPLREAEEDARILQERETLAKQPTEIGAKHILVMHADSQRKPEGVTRTREEARKRAQECLLKIRGGADFDAVVPECTDEPGAKERSGDLGVFQRSAMVKAFGDAAFSLKVGEISEVIETPYGFHIIKRTE
jgi:peptidyl-prolyl cis-trans isomerase NIMA-interacting 1